MAACTFVRMYGKDSLKSELLAKAIYQNTSQRFNLPAGRSIVELATSTEHS